MVDVGFSEIIPSWGWVVVCVHAYLIDQIYLGNVEKEIVENGVK